MEAGGGSSLREALPGCIMGIDRRKGATGRFYRAHLSAALSSLCFLAAIVGTGEQLSFTMVSTITSQLHHRPESHGANWLTTETSDKPEQIVL